MTDVYAPGELLVGGLKPALASAIAMEFAEFCEAYGIESQQIREDLAPAFRWAYISAIEMMASKHNLAPKTRTKT